MGAGAAAGQLIEQRLAADHLAGDLQRAEQNGSTRTT
jgi:hypothetical protein